jgi:hypothetical protein
VWPRAHELVGDVFGREEDGEGPFGRLLFEGDLDHGGLHVVAGFGFDHAGELGPIDAAEAPLLDGDAFDQELLEPAALELSVGAQVRNHPVGEHAGSSDGEIPRLGLYVHGYPSHRRTAER